MSIRLKIRQLVEFEVVIGDADGPDAYEEFKRDLWAGRITRDVSDSPETVIASHIAESVRTPNYAIHTDYEEQMFYIVEDGEMGFSSRDHNEVALKLGELAGIEVIFCKSHNDPNYRTVGGVLDYGDPDLFWERMASNKIISG